MKQLMKNHLTLLPFYAVVLCSLLWLLFFYTGNLANIFINSDQLGYRYYEQKEYAKAARTFEDTSLKAAAYYRDGAFNKSIPLYKSLSSKEEVLNLGNSFLMSGNYTFAIKAYEKALKIDKNFKAAQDNLLIAKSNKTKSEGNKGEGVGTSSKEGTAFDNKAGKGKGEDDSKKENSESADPNWLDRLQTGPTKFLKNKFAYEHQMKERKDVK